MAYPKAPWTAALPWSGFSEIRDADGRLIFGLAAGSPDEKRPDDELDAALRLMVAAPALLAALEVTAGNIRSLGPAGALEPYAPYREWLAVVDAALSEARGESV